MGAFLIYIVKWAFCLAVLYTPFTLLLRKETFASLNRKLLLGTVVASAILPLLVLRFTVEVEAPVNFIATGGNSYIAATTLQAAGNVAAWERVIGTIYFIGVILSLLFTIAGALKSLAAIKRGTLWVEKQKNCTIHCHANETAPFSWFGHIVISESDYNECGKEILLHEEGHILHGHSWDILLLALVKSVQWFNPFVYMLANDIKEIHEYEADKYVVEHCDNARNYQLLILKKAASSIGTQFINRFGQSNVRKRIMMMARKKSNKARCAKWLYLAPVASFILLLFAEPEYIYSRKETATTAPLTEAPQKTTVTESRQATTAPATAKKRKATAAVRQCNRPQSADTATVPAIMEEIAIIATETSRAEAPKKYASETYYEYISLQNGDTTSTAKSNIRKCSVRASFIADNNGQAGDIAIKGCDLSIKAGNENIADKIETIRSAMINAAEEYIKSKEWAAAIIDGEKAHTIYDAHIVYCHGEREAQQAKGNCRPMLVGSTAIN